MTREARQALQRSKPPSCRVQTATEEAIDQGFAHRQGRVAWLEPQVSGFPSNRSGLIADLGYGDRGHFMHGRDGLWCGIAGDLGRVVMVVMRHIHQATIVLTS